MGLSEALECHRRRLDSLYLETGLINEQVMLGSKIMHSFYRGDEYLNNGAIIDSSCFSGPREKKRSEIKNVLDQTIAFILKRVDRCKSYFGFKEIDGVKNILKQTVILCGADESNDAKTLNTIHTDYEVFKIMPQLGYLSPHRKAASSLVADVFGYMVAINQRVIMENLDDPANIASTFFHELLHHLRANQRAWHNGAPETRSETGCEKSVFEDYIYFVEAVCTPESDSGNLYWHKINGVQAAAGCKEVCLSALTTPTEREKNEEDNNYQGPSVHFSPYPQAQAEAICTKIQNSDANWIDKN